MRQSVDAGGTKDGYRRAAQRRQKDRSEDWDIGSRNYLHRFDEEKRKRTKRNKEIAKGASKRIFARKSALQEKFPLKPALKKPVEMPKIKRYKTYYSKEV